MAFIENQKVRVKKEIRSDGTCAGCDRGFPVALLGEEGFICEITEFLFDDVYVVHFVDKNQRIGFRESELDLVEDFDPETGQWEKVA